MSTVTGRAADRSTTRVAGSVVTPEAVQLDYVVGGIGTRAFAKVVDLLAMAAVAFALLFLLGIGVTFLQAQEVVSPAMADTIMRILLALVIFFVGLFLVPICETRWNGRTPGKSMMGLRVVNDIGETVTFGQALTRSLVQLVELPTAIGLIVALTNPRNQRIGDLSAGTFVIHDRGQLVAPLLIPTVFPPPAGCERVVAAMDISSLTSREFVFIRDYLLRVRELTPEARASLGGLLIDHLAPRVSVWPPAGMPPELYINCIASAYQLDYFGGVLPRGR